MHPLNILNNYTPEEVIEAQAAIVKTMVEAVEAGEALPSYRGLAKLLGMPLLFVTKVIEKSPELSEIMALARTALASEVEARLAQLAQGGFTEEMMNDKGETKFVSRVTKEELRAQELILGATSPAYNRRSASVKIENMRVSVGQEGREEAISALDELHRFIGKQ